MNFHSIGKGVMVEVHGGIMKSRFRIFAQCNESRFQFRFHFRIPEEVFSSRGDDRRDAVFSPSSDVITSPMISVISGVIMDAGVWCRMVKSALAPMEAAAFPAAPRSFESSVPSHHYPGCGDRT